MALPDGCVCVCVMPEISHDLICHSKVTEISLCYKGRGILAADKCIFSGNTGHTKVVLSIISLFD